MRRTAVRPQTWAMSVAFASRLPRPDRRPVAQQGLEHARLVAVEVALEIDEVDVTRVDLVEVRQRAAERGPELRESEIGKCGGPA